MAQSIKAAVNGQPVDLPDSDEPLLFVLRNSLALRATRQGCLAGECGACTVLVDGHAVMSCTIAASSLEGATIETVEALETDRVGRALVEAFLAHQAGQCGYCLAGILMRAGALLREAPEPLSRAQIAAALDRNLCRCGAHLRILDAVEAAARRLAAPEEISS